jgi:hypothetical protein
MAAISAAFIAGDVLATLPVIGFSLEKVIVALLVCSDS